MGKVERFEDLRVWRQGIELVKQVYGVTGQGKLARDFGLRDQMRRAAVSVPTNIAEGFERRSRKEYLQFLNIAKGSVGEVRSLLRVALEVGYLDSSSYEILHDQAVQISRMLAAQMKGVEGKG
ncbi:MAG: four helix bundle protein [Cyanobacteria bacterium P01_D01_bin.14]